MSENEFDERIAEIKRGLDIIFKSPLVQTHTIDKREGSETLDRVVDVRNNLRMSLELVAAHINQIELGIKKYARPKTWDLIQEGIKN